MSRVDDIRVALASERYSYKALADGSGVVLDLEDMRVLSLNPSAMFLVEQIAAGAASADELGRRLTSEFEVDQATARGDVEELLGELDRHLAPRGN